jgi:hypothetical protein
MKKNKICKKNTTTGINSGCEHAHNYQGCLCGPGGGPPPPPPPPHACLTRKYRVYSSIFEHIRAYSSIFEHIRAYSSIFEVFLKKIQRICPIRPVRARCNGQACRPAHLLRPPVSLQTPNMTTLTTMQGDLKIEMKIIFLQARDHYRYQ